MHLQTFTKQAVKTNSHPSLLAYIDFVMLCDPLIQRLTAQLKFNLPYKSHLISCITTAILSILTRVSGQTG